MTDPLSYVWELLTSSSPDRSGDYWRVCEGPPQITAGGTPQRVRLSAWYGMQQMGSCQATITSGRLAIVQPPGFDRGFDFCEATAIEQLGMKARRMVEPEPLLRSLLFQLVAGGVQVVQVTLSLGDEQHQPVFLAAGFRKVANLEYLAALPEVFPNGVPAMPGIQWQQVGLDQLEPVWRLTTIGSRDLAGWQDPRCAKDTFGDLVAEMPHCEIWIAGTHRGEPVGCLVLADMASEVCAISYVGVVPQWRGLRWGVHLCRFAQWRTFIRGHSRLILALDAANQPAMRMYRAAGFHCWDRRQLFVWANRATP
jgi:GNAT superfamily N-acetyltransferase